MKPNVFEKISHAWFVAKNAIGILLFYIKHPYYPLIATHPCYRFNSWHKHICLPLRLGKDIYMLACPHADKREFFHEYEDECDGCPYKVVLNLDAGVPSLYGDERFVHKYGDDYVDEEERA